MITGSYRDNGRMTGHKPRLRAAALISAAVLSALSLAACGSHHGNGALRIGTATPSTGSQPAATPTSSAARPPAPTPQPKGGSGSQDSGTPSGSNGRCPGYPTPACTGVPAGTRLTDLALNDSGGYVVRTPGTVLDSVHIAGDLQINADHVVIKDSLIDGAVRNEQGDAVYHSFTITDSTVGPANGCQSNDGVGRALYTARGVYVRGHSQSFMDSGNDITIRDSYVKTCSNGNDHADSIQAYVPGANLVLDHNTLDERGTSDHTAPVYLSDSAGHTIVNVSVTRNLIMGGTYSIQLKNARGNLVVADNRMVDKTWDYAPVESECSAIDWTGNTLVTIDSGYRITSTVGPLTCKS
jgi:hypothetical protein